MARKDACTVVHFDGAQWTAYDAVRTPQGTFKTTAPERLELSGDVAIPAGRDVYVLATDRVTLLGEADFHRARRRVILSALFDNSSDLMEWGRNIAAAVAVVVAFLTYTQVSSMASSLAHALSLLK